MSETIHDLIGKELGATDWVEISQDLINQFANVTNDHQGIHVNEGDAKKYGFNTTIAHGMLTFSIAVPLVPPFLEKFTKGRGLVNYGCNKVRFLSPVENGKRIRVVPTIQTIDERANNQLLVNATFTVEIEGSDKPALTAEMLLLII